MKPLYYQYENPDNQTVYFRGYTKSYNENHVTVHTCKEVRGSRVAALKDAEKLIKKLRREANV